VAAGLGAVLGDGLIALCAAMGVGAISSAVKEYRHLIQAVGGLTLIAFGAQLYLTRPRFETHEPADLANESLSEFFRDIPHTFALTITNPATVLGLFAIFGGVSSFVEVESTIDALTMVAAIMGGSLAWWLVLSELVGRIRHKIAPEQLQLINRGAGILLFGFGGLLAGELLLKFGRVL